MTECRDGEGHEIQLRVLDKFLDRLQKVKLIKFDIEGHELQALRGAQKTILSNQPIILIEQHKKDFINGSTPSLELLKSMGYHRFATIEDPAYLGMIPRLFRRTAQSLLNMIFGQRRCIVLKLRFDKEFYPFIIAIPEWMTQRCIQ